MQVHIHSRLIGNVNVANLQFGLLIFKLHYQNMNILGYIQSSQWNPKQHMQTLHFM